MEEGKECYKKGLWTAEEDKILVDYVNCHGKGNWNSIVRKTGLKRCGKSCRLRWMNYLSPSVKKGNFTEEEEDLIIRLHRLLGNRWSLIAGRVPGRTDNQVKNYWNTHLSKKLGIKKKESTGRRRRISKSDGNSHTSNSSLESSSSIETNNKNIPTDFDHLIPDREIFSSRNMMGADRIDGDFLKERSLEELITTRTEVEEQMAQQQQPSMINLGSENYVMNSSSSSMWVSEFDDRLLLHGNASGNPGSSFMELIDGHSFDLDWDDYL